ncbi:class I SAM-dependent methyltransferase [Geodermatophilus sabuli]|uniref:Methyltransferase domain-containing protein n=1 Tax=Geodermatophilus sabuli TaxID=1564158 RepID=A0A285EHB0_9ACTN|nr:class I SAM-dependent methyltransferase [Geodermatophilus sabuli]MBB3086374.1 2-polyprenyl-3-methyl-5-hydroxy-6-metoxy-1,4-benzoquinol methylase [Geodermatophilus sabuli]SNX97411.1 Methyltransferase domain-containing protein [Geodermatophilus sabuli]
MTTTETQAGTADALAGRILAGVTATLELAAVDLGAQLGWYRALADAPATAPELADRTGTAPRYAREWLEQQAVAGILTVDDVRAESDARRYTLPAEYRGVLVDELDPAHMAPFARVAMAFVRNLPRLREAYRTGDGLGWAEMGPDAREAQGDANRPYFLGAMATEDLPRVPGVDTVLRGGGRVADVGCGMGWSAIGMARAYPRARIDGFDVDAPSVEQARRNAEQAGVADRVRFTLVDAASADGEPGGYDLVTAFECVHDMADPVAVLAAMRGMARPDGTVLVVDEKVAEQFTAPGDEVERLMYGYSLTCCLPDGLSTRPSVATGTVMRPATLERYAREAGFTGVETLPIDNDFFRFYRLVR